MSLTQNCLPVESHQTENPRRERQKAVLRCPRCPHRSPPDGDWIWRESNRGSEIRCPDCLELLTVREQFDDSDTSK